MSRPSSTDTPGPRDQAALTAAAWHHLDDLTSTGMTTLPGGKVVVPSDKELVDLLWKLANIGGRPKRAPKAMDDWKPAVTKGVGG